VRGQTASAIQTTLIRYALRHRPLCANVALQLHRLLSLPMPQLSPTLLLLISLLSASTLLTSGCGQKGDLYLPDRADNQK
jgi:hypothetical protein